MMDTTFQEPPTSRNLPHGAHRMTARCFASFILLRDSLVTSTFDIPTPETHARNPDNLLGNTGAELPKS